MADQIVEWRPVVGFENHYEVSACGQVRRIANGEILRGSLCHRGYRRVSVSDGSRRRVLMVHRAVAEAWVSGWEPGHEVNHINAVKLDNSAENLEWVTHAGNMRHAADNGLMSGGGTSVLTNEQVEEIRLLRASGMKLVALGQRFGVHHGTVSRIVRGQSRTIPTRQSPENRSTAEKSANVGKFPKSMSVNSLRSDRTDETRPNDGDRG